MTAKTQRIEMRADSDSEERITRAASLCGESISSFVLEAAVAAADRVLARRDHTIMPAEQFDSLITSLDIPDDAPTLSRIARRERGFSR